MSRSTDPLFDLDLHFLPAWAQQPAGKNLYAEHPGESVRDRTGPPRGPGRNRPGPRRPRPERGADRPTEGRGPRGPELPALREGPVRRPGPGGPPDRSGRARRPGGPRGKGGRSPLVQRVEPVEPLPEINVAFVPDEQGMESLVRQIRITGRAYPLFEIARMILQKPERHSLTLSVKPGPESQPKQPLFNCALDNSVWLSQEEAIRHVLDRHFDLFYKAERTQIEPPKGTYTFVAQCGLSGIILGPPNYHDYQKQLHKLHVERFARMPFEAFKARVKIVRDEATVKQWIDDQSHTTEYVCLNLPEPLRLGSREEVEQHFRSYHLPNIIQQVETVHVKGIDTRNLRSPGLGRLARRRLEEQRHFPLQVMTLLSQQFAARGLQFFKVNRTLTHVVVARPHYLDLDTTPVSDGVRRIVEFIHKHPGCNRKQMLDALAPGSSPAPVPTPPPPAVQDSTEAHPGSAPAGPESTAAPLAIPPEPTPEQTAVITDLHWLVHQGHVIEFATGLLETAKKPVPRPAKPEPSAPPKGSAPEPVAKTVEKPSSDTLPVVLNKAGSSESAPEPVAPEPAAAASPDHASSQEPPPQGS